MIFGYPKADLIESNAYCERVGKEYNLPTLFLTHYNMGEEELEKNVLQGGFKGLKPYFCNGKAGVNPADAGIFDYIPHEHFKVADKHGLVVMLHISRRERLKDELNIKFSGDIHMRETDEKNITNFMLSKIARKIFLCQKRTLKMLCAIMRQNYLI